MDELELLVYLYRLPVNSHTNHESRRFFIYLFSRGHRGRAHKFIEFPEEI